MKLDPEENEIKNQIKNLLYKVDYSENGNMKLKLLKIN